MAKIDPPIRVMRVIARLNVGGPAIHCTLLSKNLSVEGFKTTLVTGSPSLSEASYEQLFDIHPDGYELIRLGKLKRSISGVGDLMTLIALIMLMRREKPQIVHTHTAKAGVLGRIAAWVTGVPVVVHTFHGHVLSGYFSPIVSRLICRLERFLASKTTAIVTLSPALLTELTEKFHLAPKTKFEVIPLGRDLEQFENAKTYRDQFRAELGIQDPKTCILGCIGRLVPIKDHRTLFLALQKVDPSLDWHLVILGEGELSSELKTLAENLNLGSKIHFLGWRSDLAFIYGGLDFAVLSSLNEGTPLSVIEAFASSCPMIATKVGGVPDMFTERGTLPEHGKGQPIEVMQEGLLVPSSDARVLSKAIELFLKNESLRLQCGVNAKLASEKYSDKQLLRNVATLYRTLLEKHLVK